MKLSTGKKPSRTYAFELVLDLKFGRRDLNCDEVDSLVRFFAPPMPAKAKSAEQWVAKAVDHPQAVREYLRYVYVADGVCYASDGHRAHRCKTTMAPGYYDAATLLPVDFDQPYPEIRRVFPDRSNVGEHRIEDLEPGGLGQKNAKLLEYRRLPDSTAVNWPYLHQALNGIDAGPIWVKPEPNGSMAGDSEFGDWVIMGMRV